MKKLNRYLPITLIILSLVGFIDALYLSYARYMHVDLPCSITNGGCSVVAASPYAVMFGVPLAYLGLVFYLIMFTLTVVYYFKSNIVNFTKVLLGVTLFGAIDSLYFLYLQGFVINAFCIYCIISAIITFCLFAIVLTLYLQKK